MDLKWLGPVDRLFGWLVEEGKIEANPADGIRSKQAAAEAANAKRLPFKPDQHLHRAYDLRLLRLPRSLAGPLPHLLNPRF